MCLYTYIFKLGQELFRNFLFGRFRWMEFPIFPGGRPEDSFDMDCLLLLTL